jgi:L-histidine N-alpha-methyltransferase
MTPPSDTNAPASWVNPSRLGEAPEPAAPPLTVEVHLRPGEVAAALRADVLAGLGTTPKELPPTWLYDDLGCELFEQITGLPQYYPTRAERRILQARAGAIAAMTRADTLIELGSGSCEKTRLLLAALADAGTLCHYVPFDVAESTLRAAAEAIVAEQPCAQITGVVGDFRQHLPASPKVDAVSSLGTDLLKDRSRMVAAYNDAAGLTAAFNRNVLTRLNRELGADFEINRFEHVARFDEDNEWIEMRLRSLGGQRVGIADVALDVDFADGEEIRTEVSAKFRPDRVCAELAAAGFEVAGWWTDPDGDYALSLSLR